MTKTMMIRLILAFLVLFPLSAHAWWNDDWTQRSRITLDTGATGTNTSEALTMVPLAVRLHGGNFDFVAAREDGADLRVVAADDKTALPFHVERFDPVNELAVIWVLLQTVVPGSSANVVHVYSGNANAVAEARPGAGLDASMRAAFHFSNADGSDATGALKATAPLTIANDGLLGGALRLAGTAATWPAAPALSVAADGAVSVSLWMKADAQVTGTLWQQGPALLALRDGKLVARIGTVEVAGGEPKQAVWTHVALTLGGGKATLFVDGVQAAQGDVATPVIDGETRVGEGFAGAIDELQVAAGVRSAAWLALAAATQGIGAKGLLGVMEVEGGGGGGAGGGSHFGILIDNLTIDAWVVIVILIVMFFIAAWVMVVKSVAVIRADSDNQSFLERFRGATSGLLQLDQGADHPHAPLFKLYLAGQRELAKRRIVEADAPPLSGASLNAVKAAVDADLVRESHKLNSGMVLLTIAISGGPFLGLLGTVIGVMITFAAIAAAGDVNVNAIAPGIAAALLATVAGLAVAIPALFGYNYLAARIKNVSADMQIFVDEFVTRVAEEYGA
jgi:biopolymer transport protein ExbB